MSDEALESPAEQAPKSKKPLGFMTLLLIMVVVLVAVAGGLLYFLSDDPFADEGEVAEEDQTVFVPVVEPVPSACIYFTLPEMNVNLIAEGRARLLKAQFTIAFAEGTELGVYFNPDPQFEGVQPLYAIMNNLFLPYLRTLRPEDFDGSRGTYRLRQELLHRSRLVLDVFEVCDVLIASIGVY
jgi:hypothetical protein